MEPAAEAAPLPAEDAAGTLLIVSAAIACTGLEVTVCEATGPVILELPGSFHAEAESATLSRPAMLAGPSSSQVPTTSTLVLQKGWMQRVSATTDDEPRVEFDTATLTTAPATITWTDLRSALGPGQLTAAEATTSLTPGAPWQASGLTYAPCTCDDGGPTALTFSARTASVQPQFVLVRGGVVRLFTVPILPLPPVRIPLDPDRFRLLLPEVGYGTPGFSASLHGQAGFAGYRLTGGPAWRQDRGFRAEIAAGGPSPGLNRLGGGTSGALGWDFETGTLRGALSSTAGVVTAGLTQTTPSLRLAWDADVQTDSSYADDYGLDWVARGLPRQEQRGVIGLGAARLTLHGVTNDASPAPLEMVEARLRKEWELPNGVGPAGETSAIGLRAAFAGWGSFWESLRPLGEIGADAHGTWVAGPLRVAGTADGAIQALSLEESRLIASGTATAEIPIWTGRLQLWPGVVTTGHFHGLPSGATGYDLDEHAFVGAGTRADLVSGPWLFTGSGHVGQDELGWTGRVTAELDGPAHLAIRAGRRQQGGEVGVTSHPLSVAVGAVHRDDTEEVLTWTSADLHLARFRIGGGVSTPLPDGESSASDLWSARAFLGYDDGCTRLLVTAAESPDRRFPDLGVKLEVRRVGR